MLQFIFKFRVGDEEYRLKPPPLARKMSKLIFPRYATPHPRYVLLAQNIGGSDPDRETMKNARPKGLTIFMAGVEGFEPPNAWTKTMCLTTWRHPNVD